MGAEPDYDPAKAFLGVEEILPEVGFPASATSQPGEMPPQAIRRIVAAKELYKENRFTEAILELEKALRYSPRSFEVNRLLALICRRAGNDGRALSHLRKAVEIKSDDVVCRYLLGLYAARDKKIDEALRQYSLALKCPAAPEDTAYCVLTHFQLAELLADQGYLTAAADEYETFAASTEKADSSFSDNAELMELIRLKRGYVAGRIAGVYRRLGQVEKAVNALAKVADELREDIAIQAMYAQLLSQAKRHTEAIAVARRVLSAKPGDRQNVALLVEVYEAAGKPDQVIEALRELASARPDDVELSVALVDALIKREQYAEAEEVLFGLIERHPKRAALHWRLIGFYENRSRWVDAVVAAGRAVQTEPHQGEAMSAFIARLAKNEEAVRDVFSGSGALLASRPEAYGVPYVTGLLAAKTGDTTRARQLQQHCLDKGPGFVPALIALGEVYLAESAWKQAVGVAEKAIAGGSKEAAFRRIIGEAYDGLDDIEHAMSSYAEAARLDRRDLRSMMLLAQLYERTEQVHKAQRQYKNILSIDSGMHDAREALIRIYCRLPVSPVNHELAKNQLDTFQKLGSETAAYARSRALVGLRARQLRGRAALSPAKGEKLLLAYADELAKVAASFPEDVESLYAVAASRFQTKQYTEALAWCARVQALDADHLPTQELLIYLHRRLIQYKEARAVLESLLARRPNRKSWKLQLAQQHLIDQNFDRGVEIYRDILASEPPKSSHRVRYRLSLVDALQLAGRGREADRLIDRWLDESEGEKESRYYRSLKLLLYYWTGKTGVGVAVAKRWYEKNPGDANIRSQLFRALLQHERSAEAQRYVLEWLLNDPENKGLNESLIRSLAAGDRVEDAIELARNGAEIADQELESLDQLAMVYGAAGRHDERVLVLQRIARERRNAGQEVPLADAKAVIRALISAKRYKEAEQRLTVRIHEEQDPFSKMQLLRLLSYCYQRENKIRLAAKMLEEILEIFPNQGGICNDLGYTLADAGLELDRAEELIRIAVGEAPRSNAYMDSLGWVLYKKGDFAGAKKWLTRAVRARSLLEGSLESVDDPVLHDHLGDSLWRLGETNEAVASWKKAAATYEGFLRRHVERDDLEVLESVRAKIEAAAKGVLPPIAPLGKKDAA